MNRIRTFATNFYSMMKSVVEHRALIAQLTRREVLGRYRGSILGIGWSFLHPVLMLAVFTFVFSVVFEAKWGMAMAGESEGEGVFAVILFIGLIIHSLFSEIITRSPNVILGNVNYVKKVIFPLEILPVTIILSAIFHSTISLLVWFFAYLIIIGVPDWKILYLPFVLLPLVTLSLGISYVLASLGVFVRDIAQTMGILSTVLLFLSPVFFPVERLAEQYQPFFLLNPLTFIIEQARDVMVWGRLPDFLGLSIYMSSSLLFLLMGIVWFQTTRKGFADVL